MKNKCSNCGCITTNNDNYYYSIFSTSYRKTLCNDCLKKQKNEDDNDRRKPYDLTDPDTYCLG